MFKGDAPKLRAKLRLEETFLERLLLVKQLNRRLKTLFFFFYLWPSHYKLSSCVSTKFATKRRQLFSHGDLLFILQPGCNMTADNKSLKKKNFFLFSFRLFLILVFLISSPLYFRSLLLVHFLRFVLFYFFLSFSFCLADRLPSADTAAIS